MNFVRVCFVTAPELVVLYLFQTDKQYGDKYLTFHIIYVILQIFNNMTVMVLEVTNDFVSLKKVLTDS